MWSGGKTVPNQKQVISNSLKDHERCAYDVQSGEDTLQEEKTRLLYQVQIMQKDNSDITYELTNMVANHAIADKDIMNLNTMAS